MARRPKAAAALSALSAAGSGVEAAEVFASAKLPTAIGGSVEVNGYLYGTGSGALMCVEVPSGDVKWQRHGVGVGSLCYADGRLYVHAENVPGEVALVEATPEGLPRARPLHSAQRPPQSARGSD